MLVALLLAIQAAAAPPQRVWFRPWTSVEELAEVLRSVPEGRAILEAALKKDPQLLQHVKAGDASFTESFSEVSLRAFDGKENGSTGQLVNLKRGLPLSDAAADFVHELTHYTERPAHDPYKDDLSVGPFVRKGIEGEGGELRAFTVECRTAWALESNDAAFPKHQFCERYRGPQNQFRSEAARADYYALGTFYPKASAELRKALPELTEAPALFRSGSTQKPYPISFAEDLARLKKNFCAVNRQKYLLTAQPPKNALRPSVESVMAERKRLEDFAHKNCR